MPVELPESSRAVARAALSDGAPAPGQRTARAAVRGPTAGADAHLAAGACPGERVTDTSTQRTATTIAPRQQSNEPTITTRTQTTRTSRTADSRPSARLPYLFPYTPVSSSPVGSTVRSPRLTSACSSFLAYAARPRLPPPRPLPYQLPPGLTPSGLPGTSRKGGQRNAVAPLPRRAPARSETNRTRRGGGLFVLKANT